MKRIFSFLFAIITLVGTTGVFTSCQEDAPEINYTINITVNNDFTEVVNAINNGTMKQEAAIAALTAAINQMNGDQAAKLQALVEAINSLATTVEAKLAIIEAAMKAQTLALESKLGILTAAVKSQTIKQEELAKLLSTAIDNLSGTLEDKLAAVEAAMKAQTLSLENKLALLEAAIKALPDYTDQLKAIEAAIKGMPDYSNKLAAIETAIKNIPDYSEKMDAIEAAIKNAPNYTTALEEIKKAIAALPNYTEQLGAIITAIEVLPDYSKQLEAIAAAVEAIPDYSNKFDAIQTALAAIAEKIEAQEGQYADELEALKASIDAIKSEVAAGNKSQEDALAEIIALLKSGAIADGGSGSGGSEDATPFVKLGVYSDWKRSNDDDFYCCTVSLEDAETVEFEGAIELEPLAGHSTLHWLKLDAQIATIKVRGNFSKLAWDGNGYLKSIDISNYPGLQYLHISFCRHVESITISKEKNTELSYLNCRDCEFNDDEMTALVASLPDRTGKETGTFIPKNDPLATKDYENVLSSANVNIAKAKNWKVVDDEGNELPGDF